MTSTNNYLDSRHLKIRYKVQVTLENSHGIIREPEIVFCTCNANLLSVDIEQYAIKKLYKKYPYYTKTNRGDSVAEILESMVL